MALNHHTSYKNSCKRKVYGKISVEVHKPNGVLTIKYNALDQKVSQSTSRNVTEYFVYDPSGNVLASYGDTIFTTNGHHRFSLHQLTIYGSSRIGLLEADSLLWKDGVSNVVVNNVYSQKLDLKRYELSNHLDNVSIVITDRKILQGNGQITAYKADIVSATDYYAYGMETAERSWSGKSYRYSINGQEKSPELAPNHTTAEFWEYDARSARRWNIDLVVKPHESSYLCFNGNPELTSDVNGDDGHIEMQKQENGSMVGKVKAKLVLRGGDLPPNVDRQQYLNNIQNNIISNWNQHATSQNVTLDWSEFSVEWEDSENPANPNTPNQTIITIGFNQLGKSFENDFQVSSISGPKGKTGFFYFSNGGSEAVHEFGHILGLSDRYADGTSLGGSTMNVKGDAEPSIAPYLTSGKDESFRATIPIYLSPKIDPDYQPYNNAMSVSGGAGTITPMQWNIVTSPTAKETNYRAGYGLHKIDKFTYTNITKIQNRFTIDGNKVVDKNRNRQTYGNYPK